MEFRSNDPGAVQYGNFINYYKFNSAGERLKLLPREVWLPQSSPAGSTRTTDEAAAQPYLLLDVGCNTGVLTQMLWQYLSDCTGRPVYILGVDIDAALIERAKCENQQREHISYASVDVMDEAAFAQVEEFLQAHQRRKFDAVCCFSITMWIHLNHHDSGLQQFLGKLAAVAALFVVEPQPWRCYQTAERRLKKAGETFPLFLALEWRSQVEQQIQTFLEETLGRRKIHECCPTQWKRRICFYR